MQSFPNSSGTSFSEMFSNRTLIDEIVTPSTSQSSDYSIFDNDDEDDPFPEPADPFEDKFVNITEIYMENEKSINSTDSSFSWTVDHVLNFIDLHQSIIYITLLIGLVLVVAVVVGIVVWMWKNKKRLINQQNDPVLTSNYEHTVKWKSVCCCFNKPSQQISMDHRQNSSSNLESYGRREPLPSIAYKNPEIFQKNDQNNSIDEANLAIHIDAINNVPSVFIPQEQYRELPPLRLPKTNIYQNYQK